LKAQCNRASSAVDFEDPAGCGRLVSGTSDNNAAKLPIGADIYCDRAGIHARKVADCAKILAAAEFDDTYHTKHVDTIFRRVFD
jgi:hypothetical protein